MNHLKTIRQRLGLTQQAIATELGCTQGNVGHYERGQTLPPDVARKLIKVANEHGLLIGFDHVYGEIALPEVLATPTTQEASHG